MLLLKLVKAPTGSAVPVVGSGHVSTKRAPAAPARHTSLRLSFGQYVAPASVETFNVTDGDFNVTVGNRNLVYP
jgi:hypothetical protein